MITLEKLSIQDTHEYLIKGEFSAEELAQDHIRVIEEKNENINAYLEVFDDVILQAKNADKRIKEEGERAHLLLGIPIAIKDNILIKNKISSCASRALENYRASYTSFVIQKLEDAGAVFLGRTNMDEFAMGSSTENSAFGATKNPIDLKRVPGGSSGGSAAAVAMGGALCALGSDTAGSVRQPASFCGVVGMKGTYGMVSRSGLVAMTSSLDQIGPITKTVGDAEILFNTIAGADQLDSTSLSDDVKDKHKKEIKEKMVIGVPSSFFDSLDGLDKDVVQNFNDSVKILDNLGHKVVSINIPDMKYVLPAYYIIMPAEVSSNLARFDGVRYGLHKDGDSLFDDYTQSRGEGFGEEVKRRILLGTYVLRAGYYDEYYNKAISIGQRLKNRLSEIFQKVDVIAMPTTLTPAFKLGEKNKDPLSMYLSDMFTAIANIAGVPAISIPSGTVSRDGVNLPLGLQLLGPHFGENILFTLGKEFEKQQG